MSNTLIPLPMRIWPYTERALPKRASFRREKELLQTMKSNTDMEEPRRPTPKIDRLEPNRTDERMLRLDPTFIASRTESDDPKRARP
jgi:hypothetical protein